MLWLMIVGASAYAYVDTSSRVLAWLFVLVVSMMLPLEIHQTTARDKREVSWASSAPEQWSPQASSWDPSLL